MLMKWKNGLGLLHPVGTQTLWIRTNEEVETNSGAGVEQGR